MNALQPDRAPSQIASQRRARTRSRSNQRRAQRQLPHQSVAIETAVKLSVNLVLAAVAVATLVRLIPHNSKQQADLQRLQAEVEAADTKVAELQADFDRHFDPQQAFSVMQEQNIRFNPKQRPVVWLTPDNQKADTKLDGPQQADSSLLSPD